jgi:hypothetical protein
LEPSYSSLKEGLRIRVEKGVAETFSGGGKVGPGIFEDVLEVG